MDSKGEWFEIYNNLDTPSLLNGVTISGGLGSGFTVLSEDTIPAGGYAVFATRPESLNGGISDIFELYTIDQLRFYSWGSIGLYSPEGTLLDDVSYDSTDTYPSSIGSSMSLGQLTAEANDMYSFWCESTSTYGDGDFGTPGTANDTCDVPTLSTELSEGDIIVSEIMHSPQAVSDFRGEWFEIYNNSDSSILVNGVEIVGSHGTGFVIESNTIIPAKGYAVFASRSEILNGGISDVFEVFDTDELRLYSAGTISIYNPLGALLDEVVYDSTSGHPSSIGSSMFVSQLSSSETSWQQQGGEQWPEGDYVAELAVCQGECGSHHPHSEVYDVKTAKFSIQ